MSKLDTLEAAAKQAEEDARNAQTRLVAAWELDAGRDRIDTLRDQIRVANDAATDARNAVRREMRNQGII